MKTEIKLLIIILHLIKEIAHRVGVLSIQGMADLEKRIKDEITTGKE